MKIKAYAKINISLDIVGKRESDGYHLLKMIMQNIDLYDEISIEKQKKDIRISCNKSYVPTDSRNLAYKAANLFKETYNIEDGVHIDIVKNIPVSAGLAGGSTDAAAVLKLMNKIFKVNASNEELMELGLKLGADIPYCINGGTALCEGIGEKITALQPFKDKILVLVKPSFGVSTKEVYKAFNLDRVRVHPKTENLIKAMEQDDLYYVANNMKNLLENVTLRKHNILIKIKEEMNRYGAVGSMMSGSGPSVFAFFDDMLKAQRCYEKMKENHREVFLTRTI
ncbi:4-(cytidine 5'-diphospho)-2-C-methyl-D-erythritol kinase [Clostridium sp.]|uniref:4-(cytidine 5'-diphospho)-2-C-methyl-D-erythritol kinase n=1 Tax=Clostridium sp. TaxID=1506 RepID=UPI0026045FD8|nr:4-(cytidine 5'-diphospho)-2-C-methyl-D-erythritol kinase [Clostridium sp.]